MLLETSDKTSTFGKKIHIKKGYYPGKLLKVELFTDKDGSPKIGKYGQQLIFEFQVYKERLPGQPDEPLMITPEDGGDQIPVVISKFVYHKYKKTDKNDKWIDGEYQTAITPNSAITRIMKALGWVFSSEKVDPENFIGRFAELNIDDYDAVEGTEKYKASTIKDINPIDEPEDISAEPKIPKEISPEDQAEIDKLETSKQNLINLKESGDLTEKGYNDAVEQVESKIKELKR